MPLATDRVDAAEAMVDAGADRGRQLIPATLVRPGRRPLAVPLTMVRYIVAPPRVRSSRSAHGPVESDIDRVMCLRAIYRLRSPELLRPRDGEEVDDQAQASQEFEGGSELDLDGASRAGEPSGGLRWSARRASIALRPRPGRGGRGTPGWRVSPSGPWSDLTGRSGNACTIRSAPDRLDVDHAAPLLVAEQHPAPRWPLAQAW